LQYAELSKLCEIHFLLTQYVLSQLRRPSGD